MTDNRESLFVQTYDSRLGNFVQPTNPQLQPSISPDSISPEIDSPKIDPSEIDPPTAESPEIALSKDRVTVELPADILAALLQQREQLGQTQTQTQIILDVLRSALGLTATPSHSDSASVSDSASDTSALPSARLMAEIEQLKARLSQLETVMQRVEILEGKSIAF